MNTHPGRHKEQPCIYEHSYYCAVCGNLFAVDADSHWRHPSSGKVFVCLYWPACSFTCFSLRVRPETYVLDEALARGDTDPVELELLYDYIATVDEFIEPDLGDTVL